MRKINIFVVFIGLLCLASCAATKVSSMRVDEQLPEIDNVHISGPIHLKLIVSHAQSRLSISGSRVAIKFANKTLNLSLPAGGGNAANVNLQLQQLKNISLDGVRRADININKPVTANFSVINSKHLHLIGENVVMPALQLTNVTDFSSKGFFDVHQLKLVNAEQVDMEGLHSSSMHIDQEGAGIAALHGYIDATAIKQMGSGSLDIYWLRSQHVYVNSAGQTELNLAGTAHKLTANIGGQAQLKSRFFKSRTIYIKTTDKATAEVHASKLLFARAADYSHIHYYGTPRDATELYPTDSGSILPSSH